MIDNIKEWTKKNFIQYFPFILFGTIVLISTRKFLFTPGYIMYSEFLGSTDYWFLLKEFLNGWGNYTSFGHSNIGLSTSYGLSPVFWILPPGYFVPLLAILSFFQLFLGNFTMKFYILSAIVAPFLGMYFFAKYWYTEIETKDFWLRMYSFLAALVYSINFIMGDRISAAHLRYNLAHGLFPVLMLVTLRAIEKKKLNFRYVIAAGLIFGILIWLMPHLIILYVTVTGIYFLVVLKTKENFYKLLQLGIVSIGIGFLLNIHIWLPGLLYPEPLTYIIDPSYLMLFVYLTSNGFKYVYTFLWASGLEDLVVQKKLYSIITILKIGLPILAISGFFIQKNRRKAFFLLIIAVVGIIFSIGTKFPFEKMFVFLFEHVFLFKPFRDVGKFLILSVFSISLLVPIGLMYLRKFLSAKKMFIPVGIFTLYVLIINPNYISGNFSNTIVPFELPAKYHKLAEFLNKDEEDYRVAIYPNTKTIGEYDWFPDIHSPSAYYNVFQSILPLSKDLAISSRVMTDYQSRYLDYLETNIDKPWAMERLGSARVKYIIVDHSVPDYMTTLTALENNPAVTKFQEQDGFTLFEIKNYTNNHITKQKTAYYFGDITGLSALPSDLSLVNLGMNDDEMKLIDMNYSDSIIFYNSKPNDLFYNSLKKYKLSFFPEVRFARNPSEDFFVPAAYLRDLTQKGIMFYNNEIIRTIGTNNITKTFQVKPGYYRLLVSTLTAEDQSDSMKITVNDKEFIQEHFVIVQNTAQWQDAGTIQIDSSKATVTIKNLTDRSLYVDHLLLVPSEEFDRRKKEFDSALHSLTIINANKLKSYDDLKFTKSVDILSNSYSPYWDICGKEVFRINFFATGSSCSNDFSIRPTFKPEVLYRVALALSFFLYTILFAFVIFKNKSKV